MIARSVAVGMLANLCLAYDVAVGVFTCAFAPGRTAGLLAFTAMGLALQAALWLAP